MYIASRGKILFFRFWSRRQMPLFGLYGIFHSSDFFSRSTFSFSPEPDFVPEMDGNSNFEIQSTFNYRICQPNRIIWNRSARCGT
jgi:hypothetical protein